MNRIPLGIVGARFALDIIDGHLAGNYGTAAAVFDPNGSLIEKYEPIFLQKNVYVFRDYRKFVKCGIKAVAISSGADRVGYVVKALRNRLDVLCEPPMAMNIDELDRIERAVRDSGRRYVLASYQCHRRETLLAEKLYRRGDIGKLLYAEGNELVEDIPDIPINLQSAGSIGQVLKATALHPERVKSSKILSRNVSIGIEELEFASGAVCRALNASVGVSSGMRLIGEWGVIETGRGKVVLTDNSGIFSKITSYHPEGFMLDGMIKGAEFSRSSAIAGFCAMLAGSSSAADRCIAIDRALDMSIAARSFPSKSEVAPERSFGINIEHK